MPVVDVPPLLLHLPLPPALLGAQAVGEGAHGRGVAGLAAPASSPSAVATATGRTLQVSLVVVVLRRSERKNRVNSDLL